MNTPNIKPAKLSDLVNAVASIGDGVVYFYNIESGKLVLYYESGENSNEAHDISKNPDKYIALPKRRDMNDIAIMKNFAYQSHENKIKRHLLNSLDGKGAFTHFRNETKRLGIEDLWYKYLEITYSEILEKWCIKNKVPFEK